MNEYCIEDLIPHRAPIKMVDHLNYLETKTAITFLILHSDMYLLESDGILSEAGIIEHIAQSASALAGYLARMEGADSTPIGYIGEIRKFQLYRKPRIGETLKTKIVYQEEFGDFVLMNGETQVEEEMIATLQLKVYISNHLKKP